MSLVTRLEKALEDLKKSQDDNYTNDRWIYMEIAEEEIMSVIKDLKSLDNQG